MITLLIILQLGKYCLLFASMKMAIVKTHAKINKTKKQI
jgi:hypothetical protein